MGDKLRRKMGNMKLESLPKLKTKNYTERLTIPVTAETKNKVGMLKTKGVDAMALIRQLIDRGLEPIKL